jgi:hypothetical protein
MKRAVQQVWKPVLQISAGLRQFLSRLPALRVVEVQPGTGRASDGRQRDDATAFGPEVLGPRVGSRIEQRHDAIGFRVHRSNVRPFEAIALEAGEGEVGQFGLSTVLRSNDVVGRLLTSAAATAMVMMLATVAHAQNSLFLFDANGNLTVQIADTIALPQILGQPQTQIVIPGESATFSVVVADTRGLSYQWLFNGTSIPGATTDALLLANVSTTNEGPYSVIVSNAVGPVLSDPGSLFIDSDGDSLPDSWELSHFGNLTNTATGDFDGDGVSNLQEFLDGTNPTNAASARFRLTILMDGGLVAKVPDQSSYTNGDIVTLTATASGPEPFHGWTGDILTRSNSITLVMTTNKTVFAHFNPITFLWTNTLDGDWDAAANWTPNLTPGSNDSVVIERGVTVTLNSTASCTDVIFGGNNSNPTLSGAGTLTINRRCDWLDGAMSGTGKTIVGPAATLNIANSGSLTLNSRTVENRGEVLWTGTGALNVGFAAVITNAPGALFEVQNPNAINFGGGSPSRFDNAGTFRALATTQIGTDISLNNSGLVDIQGGTLTLDGGGANTGSINVPAGTALNLAFGSFTSTVGSSITGAGQLLVSGATATLAGLVNVTGTNTFNNGTANLTGNYFCTNGTLIISGGTANFDGTGAVTPQVVNLSSGALAGAQTVTVGSAMSWTGGAINGTGRTVIPPGATLAIANPSSIFMTSRTLENGGTALWTGAGIIGLNNAVITNRAGALFEVQTPTSIFFEGGVSRFDNAGTFRKSVSAGTTFIGVSLNNDSVVQIQSGTLSLGGGGLNNGSINVPGGTTLELSGGVFASSPGSSIAGAGQFTVSSGTATLAGLVNVTGTNTFSNGTANLTGNYFCTNGSLLISGGTANFDGTGTVTPLVLNLSNGALGGAQTITVGSAMSWTGGAMNGTGRTVIPPGATLAIANPSSIFMTSRTLENGGTALWTGAGIIGLNNAVITNRAGALFEVQTPTSIFFEGGVSRFDNAGTFRKSVSAGTTFIGVSLNNDSVVQIQSGTLSLGGGGLNNGSISVPGGTTLELSGGVFASSPGSSIAGAGQFKVSSGTATLAGLVNVTGTNTFSNGTANLTGNYFCTNGNLLISGGTVNFDGTGAVTPQVVNLSSGTLGGAQTVTVASAMNWTGGAMNGTGRTVIPPSGTFSLGSPNTLFVTSRTLENGGTMIWTGVGAISLNAAVITNRLGALFSAQNAAQINFGGGAPRFDNAGTFRKSVSTGTTAINNVSLTNYGTVDIQTGILLANGGYASASNAVLSCAVGGTIPGTNFGQLQVAGTVTLNGALTVGLANGYLPAVGDSFTILTAGTRNSTFATFNYPSNAVTMQLSNTANSVVARVSAVFVVPQPVLFSPVLSGSNLLFTWTAVSNTLYRVEFNPDLTPSNWNALPGDVTGVSNTASKQDALTPSNRFYRVRVLP